LKKKKNLSEILGIITVLPVGGTSSIIQNLVKVKISIKRSTRKKGRPLLKKK